MPANAITVMGTQMPRSGELREREDGQRSPRYACASYESPYGDLYAMCQIWPGRPAGFGRGLKETRGKVYVGNGSVKTWYDVIHPGNDKARGYAEITAAHLGGWSFERHDDRVDISFISDKGFKFDIASCLVGDDFVSACKAFGEHGRSSVFISEEVLDTANALFGAHRYTNAWAISARLAYGDAFAEYDCYGYGDGRDASLVNRAWMLLARGRERDIVDPRREADITAIRRKLSETDIGPEERQRQESEFLSQREIERDFTNLSVHLSIELAKAARDSVARNGGRNCKKH